MKISLFTLIIFLLFSCDNNKFNSERQLITVDTTIFVHGASFNDIAVVRCKNSIRSHRSEVIAKDSVRIETIVFEGEKNIYEGCYVQIYK